MKVWQISRLALADLRHDWLVSLCMITSLVAVIAPMLLLFGLKYGVVSALQEQLLNDPRNLEIRMLSSGSYDDAWVAALADRPEAGFVLGLTRSLNAQADLLRSGTQFIEGAEVLPTAEGDPLLAGVDPGSLARSAAVLSAQAAARLGVQAGDEVRMRISRRLDGRSQQVMLTLKVHAVLSSEAYARLAAFVHPDVLRDMEWYRDGYAVAALGADADYGQPLAEARRNYAKARVYARDMDSVETLERTLNEMRIETSSRLADIRNVQAIDRLLSTVFAVIAGTAVLGCMASLAGAFLANVRRKRREISILRLVGLSGSSISVYMVMQAMVLTAIAFVVGLVVYAVGSGIFNQLLGQSAQTGGYACQIMPVHAFTALAATLVMATAASMLGAASARRIQPAESLREI